MKKTKIGVKMKTKTVLEEDDILDLISKKYKVAKENIDVDVTTTTDDFGVKQYYMEFSFEDPKVIKKSSK